MTSGMPQQLFHLAYEGCCIATTIIGHYGRNPSLLMPKMESTSDTPGGPNLMYCCDRLPNFRWRPGRDWKDTVVVTRYLNMLAAAASAKKRHAFPL